MSSLPSTSCRWRGFELPDVNGEPRLVVAVVQVATAPAFELTALEGDVN